MRPSFKDELGGIIAIVRVTLGTVPREFRALTGTPLPASSSAAALSNRASNAASSASDILHVLPHLVGWDEAAYGSAAGTTRGLSASCMKAVASLRNWRSDG